MTQPVEPQPAPAGAAKGGRGKLIAIIVVVVVILVAIAAVAIYYLGQPPAANTIKLGFTISLTGTYNIEGTNSLNGIKTAVQWINTHGGVTVNGTSYQISLDYVDDQSLSTNIPTTYTSFVTTDHDQFLLAPYSSGLTAAAAPVADTYNTVMLSHGGASDTIFQHGYKNVVEVLSPASGYLKGALDYLKANHPTDKIALLYANDAFSIICGQGAAAYAASLGLNVVYNQSYPSTATDLSTQLTAAKNAGATDLLGGGHFTDGVAIMQQLTSVAWTPSFVSLLVAVTEGSFQSQLHAASNNVTGPSQWETSVSYTPSMATAAGFTWYGPSGAQFTSLYGNLTSSATPTYHSGEAAATVFILAHAIQVAQSLNTASVRAALGSMKAMTFFGEFQVSSTGLQIAHSMVVDQWQAGALKVVWPTSVASAAVQYPYTGS
ncbi:MAG TPA: amino acid ABC transporter substrate-binding protein [Thermoplasmata archaeon]|nr:amino acid ABC transporter substrate-binding protein [Thermoplasmata archaeon]